MTKKPVAPEKKRNMWRGHKILFPIAATTLAACGVGFFAVYSCGFFINKPITGATSYVFLFIFSFSFLIVYLPHYFISGKDKRGHWQCVSRAWVCAALLMMLAGAFDVYNTRCFVNVAPQIELQVWIGGILSILGLVFLIRRTQNQEEQLENQSKQLEIQTKELENQNTQTAIQTKKEIEDRFIAAVTLLGSSQISARIGAIYSLYQLAKEHDKYRGQIAQILCSHICTKTQEDKYRTEHKDRPSNEIQTAIDILFKGNGLYCQSFARKNPYFPRANLSRAYLHGANFVGAQCQRADFRFAKCEKADFYSAQCQRAIFRAAQCYKASFIEAQCQRADFSFANCYSATFANANCHKANFTLAQLAGASFFVTKCYGARFESAQCQSTGFGYAECQGAYFRSAQCQSANFRSAKCQGANFYLTAFQSASFNEKTDFCGAYSHDASDSLEGRIGKTTEVVAAIFGGELSQESVEAIEEVNPYASDEWYQEMQNLINENKGKPEFCIVPEHIATGVLKDSEEIREIAEEIRKWEQ